MSNVFPLESAGVRYRLEPACRLCGGERLSRVLDLGETPLADRLTVAPDEPQPRIPLLLVQCRDCGLVQLAHSVAPEALFGPAYAYHSSVSPELRAHFREAAEQIMARKALYAGSLVVEIAGNDGCMIENFARRGARVLNIEPAPGPARAARERGLPTKEVFFGLDLARRLVQQGLRADVLVANNVLAHTPDLNGFAAGLALLLADDGLLSVEVPSLVELVRGLEFDTIYHQHLCCFSLSDLDRLFSAHGLVVNDARELAIHGGSLRLFISCGGERSPRVERLLRREAGLDTAGPRFMANFAEQVDSLRRELADLVRGLKTDGARIWAYGAAAKGATLLAACGLGRDEIDCVADLNPHKHGLHMPGSGLHIVPAELLTGAPASQQPEYVLLLAWNFAREIMEQQREYTERGGRWIIPLPRPIIL